MALLDATSLAVDLRHAAAARGVSLSVSEDFRAFGELSRTLAGRGSLSPMFDPAYSALDEERAFWVVGRDRAGAVVHLQAFRLDWIESSLSETFADWLVPLYRSTGDDPRPAAGGLSPSPLANRIAGRVAYHGELWIRPSAARGMIGLSDLLPRFGLIEAYLRWQPDWLYGFVSERKACRGLPIRWGYTICQPGVLCWDQPLRDCPLVEWLAAASRADIEHLVTMQAHDPGLEGLAKELAAVGS